MRRWSEPGKVGKYLKQCAASKPTNSATAQPAATKIICHGTRDIEGSKLKDASLGEAHAQRRARIRIPKAHSAYRRINSDDRSWARLCATLFASQLRMPSATKGTNIQSHFPLAPLRIIL